jgi:hypothetical protein
MCRSGDVTEISTCPSSTFLNGYAGPKFYDISENKISRKWKDNLGQVSIDNQT